MYFPTSPDELEVPHPPARPPLVYRLQRQERSMPTKALPPSVPLCASAPLREIPPTVLLCVLCVFARNPPGAWTRENGGIVPSQSFTAPGSQPPSTTFNPHQPPSTEAGTGASRRLSLRHQRQERSTPTKALPPSLCSSARLRARFLTDHPSLRPLRLCEKSPRRDTFSASAANLK